MLSNSHLHNCWSIDLWSLDPILDGDPQQFEKLKAYVLWYFTKDDDQMVRIKPTAKARTLTMGQMR
jgi:hypothetical protein